MNRVNAPLIDPNTLVPLPEAEGVRRPKLFDPSLRHFRQAFRHGEPLFRDAAVERQWLTARRAVMGAILQVVSRSPLVDHLVLRGSALLKSWFPEQAREPGDLDWVVVPSSMTVRNDWSVGPGRTSPGLFDLLREEIGKRRFAGDIELFPGDIRTDEIWSYERAPGRRVVLPWKAPGLPPGIVQMDFSFGEALPDDPILESIPYLDDNGELLQVVSREQSLISKLQWLLTDGYPQGKDLYDAVLLADAVPFRFDRLRMAVVEACPWWRDRALTVEAFARLKPDWDNFLAEYPGIAGTAQDWIERLVRAIQPSFAVRS